MCCAGQRACNPTSAQSSARYGIKKRHKAAFRQAISESRPARKCGLLNTILFERRATGRRTTSNPAKSSLKSLS